MRLPAVAPRRGVTSFEFEADSAFGSPPLPVGVRGGAGGFTMGVRGLSGRFGVREGAVRGAVERRNVLPLVGYGWVRATGRAGLEFLAVLAGLDSTWLELLWDSIGFIRCC